VDGLWLGSELGSAVGVLDGSPVGREIWSRFTVSGLLTVG